MPELLHSTKVASASIAVIARGRLAFAAAYGDQSPGVAATPTTVYNIASLTKPLTAEIILRLASARRLSLDESMAVYWTDPDIAGDDRRTLLTPRLALSHQTGFPNWRGAKTGLHFDRAPGTAWGYSGEGYQYAARFAQARTGTAFETLAQRYLFGPVGMPHTTYTHRPWLVGHIALPNEAGRALEPTIGDRFNAADLVYSTPTDYARFLTDVLADRGLSAAISKERNRSQVSMRDTACGGVKAASCPPVVGFGLGWQILVFGGDTVMMHTGKDEGVFTFAYLDRARGAGLVLFTNSGEGYRLVLPILERLHADPGYLRFLRGQID
jgi:CubicO group peptidase (beta-lactamase class C family)